GQGKALEQAKSEKEVLEKYTKPKTLRELNTRVQEAKSTELAKQATWELQLRKEEKLERQIAACTLVAPNDGLAVYPNDPMRSCGSNQPQIEEGATVHERQKIISIPDLGGPWLVNAKVRETIAARVTPGQRVRVRVLGLPDQPLTGVVESVAPFPDPATFFQ